MIDPNAPIDQSTDRTLFVSEVFGPTVQGEGRSLGHTAQFVRLGGCNLECIWCDTPYTWRFSPNQQHQSETVYDPRKEIRPIKVGDLAAQLLETRTELIVITGGEPLLQGRYVAELIKTILKERPEQRFEIETNGTQVVPISLRGIEQVAFNVSPKLSNSLNEWAKRYRPEAIIALQSTGRAIFKFVVLGEADLIEVVQFVRAHNIRPQDVYIMPEGRETGILESVMAEVINKVIEYRYRLTTRLHVNIWGDKRGV